MTDATVHRTDVARTTPPFSRSIQLAVAACLIVGALAGGGLQYLEHILAGDLERRDQIAWGLAHQEFYRVEWLGGMLSSILLLLGFLGLLQVTRWYTPRLTAVSAVVLIWGMSGFVTSETGTYIAQVVAADVFGPADAERLIADGYLGDWGMIVGVLVPVVAGMFFGLLLLAVACWRSGFPRVPSAVLAVSPLWDFVGPSSVGPFTTDLFLVVAVTWLGVAVARMPSSTWLGRNA